MDEVKAINKYGKKYTREDLLEHIVVDRSYITSINIDGNSIVLQRNFDIAYKPKHEYYKVYVNEHIICNMCTKNNGLLKALGVLNETYNSNS